MRSRTSVLGAAVVSAFVAGPVGGLIIATAVSLGYPARGLDETPAAMLVVWGVVTGFIIAAPVAAVFGAQHVRRGLSLGSAERILRLRAALSGAALDAVFGADSTASIVAGRFRCS